MVNIFKIPWASFKIRYIVVSSIHPTVPLNNRSDITLKKLLSVLSLLPTAPGKRYFYLLVCLQ